MDASFHDRVVGAFAPELESGKLRIVRDEVLSVGLGAAIVVLEGQDFLVKLRTERGEDEAFIASRKRPFWRKLDDEWVWLQVGIEAAGGDEAPLELLGDPVVAAQLVRENEKRLSEAFGRRWWTTRARAQGLVRAYMARLHRFMQSPEGREYYRQLREADLEKDRA